MSESQKSLPARPSLEQLKKQAKELLRAYRAQNPESLIRIRSVLPSAGTVSEKPFALHDAQFVVAREYGFGSWNQLVDHVESLTLKFDDAVKEFLICSGEGGRIDRARKLLERHPAIARANFYTACVLGDLAAVKEKLAADPTLAVRKGGPNHWEPILYVCFSKFHREDVERAVGMQGIARVLLQNGASPNTGYAWPPEPKHKLSVLWAAAAEARHPALVKILLEAGANPNDGESVYHAAELFEEESLALLLNYGAKLNSANDVWNNTPLCFILGISSAYSTAPTIRQGVRWLLQHGADPNILCGQEKETALHVAARHWDRPILELLLRYGADPTTRRKDGRTPHTIAALSGNEEGAACLLEQGATDELSAHDRFIAGCTAGNHAIVHEMLKVNPSLSQSLAAEENQLLHEQATLNKVEALRVMLASGFDVAALDSHGATALHFAALYGWPDATRILINAGSPLEVRDGLHQATPFGWASWGEENNRNPYGDYAAVAQVLLDAGADVPWPKEEDGKWGGEEVNTVVAEHRQKAV